ATPEVARASATDAASVPIGRAPTSGGARRWVRRGVAATITLVAAAVGLAWFDGRGSDPDVATADLATAESALDDSTASGVSATEVATAGVDGSEDTTTPWPAGRAAGLSCNLLQVADFETGQLPEGYYGGDETNTTVVAPGAGVDGTDALQVGARGTFGLYGEIITLGTADRYVFSAWIRTEGEAEEAALYIDYLDANYVQLTAVRDRLEPAPPVGTVDGTRFVVESDVPERAVFAVPTVFKNGSDSTLLVDEVVFGPSETCADLAS
ncbi:MAG: hypothetical protein AAFO29_18310, partial [Actinomycetota bacterium]